jgi:2-oxoglutarate dehydrogenase E2 component (dihydrolipoamide succinyltransferase)
LDEIVSVIETDKISIEIKAPKAGILTKFHAKLGDTLVVGKPFFDIDTSAAAEGQKS